MIGILSDAHGNIDSYERAIALIDEVGVDELYFLGDAVGYVPSLDVLDRLMGRDSYVKCILGNHEDMIIKASSDDCQEEIYQLGFVRSIMSDVQLRYISRWPIKIERETFGLRVLYIHGSILEPTHGYVYPDSELSSLNNEYDYVFMGNTHRPFIRKLRSTTLINVGSCGLPRDDGRYGSFALFDPSERTVEIIRYNIENDSVDLESAEGSVHSSVLEVLARRAPQGTLVGTVVSEES
ncbi:MAG: hypothetical protein HOH43_10090 [Candidatus Latescibacteria bacterium]|jgi:putative phosphoesterase|nr:hypothetical protein [Candidatus Latescibacterota bacterium]